MRENCSICVHEWAELSHSNIQCSTSQLPHPCIYNTREYILAHGAVVKVTTPIRFIWKIVALYKYAVDICEMWCVLACSSKPEQMRVKYTHTTGTNQLADIIWLPNSHHCHPLHIPTPYCMPYAMRRACILCDTWNVVCSDRRPHPATHFSSPVPRWAKSLRRVKSISCRKRLQL